MNLSRVAPPDAHLVYFICFGILHLCKVLQSSLEMVIISSLVVEVQSENEIHSQVCNLKFEVVFLLLDFMLFY